MWHLTDRTIMPANRLPHTHRPEQSRYRPARRRRQGPASQHRRMDSVRRGRHHVGQGELEPLAASAATKGHGCFEPSRHIDAAGSSPEFRQRDADRAHRGGLVARWVDLGPVRRNSSATASRPAASTTPSLWPSSPSTTTTPSSAPRLPRCSRPRRRRRGRRLRPVPQPHRAYGPHRRPVRRW